MSTLTDLFAGIAGAIRSKTGSSDVIQAAQFAQAISAIPEGATVTVGTGTVSNEGNLQFPAGAANAVAILMRNESGFSSEYFVTCAQAISGSAPTVSYSQWSSGNNQLGLTTSNITYTPETGIMRVTLSGWKGYNYRLISW